jgi:hypothetical protein
MGLRAALSCLILTSAVYANEAQSFHRAYKATAYVTFFGVTVFSRSDVGFGSAAEDESVEDNSRSIHLQFLSGSKPERAHGLNRFGFIEEKMHEKNGELLRSDYFGLITASREESLSEARAALGAKAGDKTQYVAAQALLEGSRAKFEIRHVLLPLPHEPGAAMEMVKQFQKEFRDLPPNGTQDRDLTVTVSSLHTFLYMLVQAIGSTAPSIDNQFVYNSKPYRLHLDRKPDEKTGADLVKLGMLKSAKQAMRLNGTLENAKGERTVFALWYEQGAANPLPLRFEFRPRSYLHLVFDAAPDPGASSPEKELAWR